MDLYPVLYVIPPASDLTGAARVQRQRTYAERAVEKSAELAGITGGVWHQNAQRQSLPWNGFHWSRSHKPTMAAGVVSDAPIGIDVEFITPRGSGLFEKLASPEEWLLGNIQLKHECAGALSEDWRLFFRYWTAKEAVLKAHGRGIGGLEDCRVVEIAGDTTLRVRYENADWQVAQLHTGNHIASVACHDQQVHWSIVEDDESDEGRSE